ncbi:MAG TPA: arginine--tRNA ligase [Clostridiales bacterium]|nr:MAG: arginine--tRNA ligase [Clostridiales bacterium GWD2_32_59]HAN10680.1 arginine--tRNA ligase [Clostridiales bacterium]
MKQYYTIIEDIIKNYINVESVIIEIPPEETMGDIAIPCFQFSKALKKNPNDIAIELKELFISNEYIDKIEIAGSYLNFFLKKMPIISSAISDVRKCGSKYGSSLVGIGKNALIEHTSLNPNSPAHIGRARNALIGDMIVRLFRFEGYNVNVHYFVNDIGKQIAMLVLAMDELNNPDVSFKEILKIYIDINEKVKEDPSLEERVFNYLNLLENNDIEVKNKFKKVVDICVTGQVSAFNELGIYYDKFQYESEYIWNNTTNDILQKFEKTGKMFIDADNRCVLNLEGFDIPLESPVIVLTRGDKTSLYSLRDIAYSIDKINESSENNVILLGEDQKVYFMQIRAALDILGYKAPQIVHYAYVLLNSEKMSTRQGKVVLLEDFMRESIDMAIKNSKENNQDISLETAKKIGYGSMKYTILKTSRERTVNFDWDSALRFEGDSAVYIMYNYARICSLIRKSEFKFADAQINFSKLTLTSEYSLAKDILLFKKVIEKTSEDFEAKYITNHIYKIMKKFSTYYHEYQIINIDDLEIRTARLALVSAIKQVVENGMSILGIDMIEQF